MVNPKYPDHRESIAGVMDHNLDSVCIMNIEIQHLDNIANIQYLASLFSILYLGTVVFGDLTTLHKKGNYKDHVFGA